ncbi:hypothetical protein [Tenacibaculum sp. M341]|uniref:hypothetical protein n=1 Tax=Tenacibaculum sp. M341 TaxID=2530339 RepID=UPI0010506B06|nr:hypothetical protein [Tenacibaculum sp. M341]TCI85704.1 hypothetical protein EYW44_16085 [Tenacibaculum sp. M341]
MKRKLIILLIAFTPLISFATGQIPDIIIFKGDTLSLFSNPLEEYLEKKKTRAINHYKLEPESTACYRGYVATWEIKDNQLFLVKIDYCHDNEEKIKRKFDFVKEFGEETVLAKWFSGKILIVSGKELIYFHSGYSAIYEKEIELSISDGKITNKKVIDNSNSNAAFFTSNENRFENFIYSNLNWDRIPYMGNETKTIVIEYNSGNLKDRPEEIVIESESFFYNTFEKEIDRVLSNRPKWNRYKRKGKIFEVIFIKHIELNEKIRAKYGFTPPKESNFYFKYVICLLVITSGLWVYFKYLNLYKKNVH